MVDVVVLLVVLVELVVVVDVVGLEKASGGIIVQSPPSMLQAAMKHVAPPFS